MKQNISITTSSFLFLIFAIQFLNPNFCEASDIAKKSKIRVLIDPGHGGEDEGAAHKNIKEKVITLNVALELQKILINDKHFEPLLTRNHDEYVGLDQRKEMATNKKADIFISIHANSSTAAQAKGTEFYFENQAATDEDSMFLANRENSAKDPTGKTPEDKSNDIQNILTDLAHNEHMVLSQQLSQQLLESFQTILQIKTRAIRQAPFRVLLVTMPATLIELGFITNDEEGSWLAQKAVQKKMATSIYAGLLRFKEKLDKVHHSSLN